MIDTENTIREMETDTVNIGAIMAKFQPIENNQTANFEIAEKILKEHYTGASNSVLVKVLNIYLKDYYKLAPKSVKALEELIKDMVRDFKKSNKLETKEDDEAAMKKRREEQNEINKGIREKREAHITKLYEILKNKDGKSTDEEIEDAKQEIKELSIESFWDIEGMNVKSGNPGHLSLKKLPISDYVNKVFNIVKFGGRNWRYDWQKAFYTYDQHDEKITQEVTDIIFKVGDGDFYKFNGNAIQDSNNIIHLASTVNVYTENPFNKHSGYINTRNGVLHIDYDTRTITKMGKRPEYMFSYCINTRFDKDARDTEIHRVLVENLGELQTELIYQLAAICIRDADPSLTPSKICFLFIGPRNTGKTIVMQILSEFFGSEIVARIKLLDVSENQFVKPLLEGKLINLDDEVPATLPLKESGEIKRLTGSKFHTLNPKNQKPYPAVLTAIHVFAGNQFPKCNIQRGEDAFWDRWEIITFDKKQHKVDEGFLARLLTPENLSGFFNRVIEKLFDIHNNKIIRKKDLGYPNAYDEWMYGSNSVYRFIRDMTVPSDTPCKPSKKEFFEQYSLYCSDMDIKDVSVCETSAEFGHELKNIIDVKDVRPEEDDGERVYAYKIMREYVPELRQVVLKAKREKEQGAKPEVPLYIKPEGITDDYLGFYVSPEITEPEPPNEYYVENEDGEYEKRYE